METVRQVCFTTAILLAVLAAAAQRTQAAAESGAGGVREVRRDVRFAARCTGKQEGWRRGRLCRAEPVRCGRASRQWCRAAAQPGSLADRVIEAVRVEFGSAAARAESLPDDEGDCRRRLGKAAVRYVVVKMRDLGRGRGAADAEARASEELQRIAATCTVDDQLTLGRNVRTMLARLTDHELLVGAPPRPNIVLVVTDDQRWDMVDDTHGPGGRDLMPHVRAELAASGVEFTNAIVTTPLCCPSRASILTGQYASTHGVRVNHPPLGGAPSFDDSSTVATWLQAAGYRTAILGKYMNGYELLAQFEPPYVAPGWDLWQVFVIGKYFNYTLVEDGVRVRYGNDEAHYSTDVLRDKALQFIDDSSADGRPFFLFLNPRAPHLKATPAARHAGLFADIEPWRSPSYAEDDRSDKPEWVRRAAPLSRREALKIDKTRADMLASMLAVDDAVGAIMARLRLLGIADDTLVIFTSDNGFLWGEHGLDRKRCPYEECIRVPMIAHYPRLAPQARTSEDLVANIDLAPTFAELAGIVPGLRVDGRSLLGAFTDAAQEPRQELLIEGWSNRRGHAFAGVRGLRWKYVEHESGELELYDLVGDPHELENLAGRRDHRELGARLAERLRELRPGWPADARPQPRSDHGAGAATEGSSNSTL